MGGWKNLSHPYADESKTTTRTCNCGRGKVIIEYIVTEESDYPPFDRGYERTYTTCPNNCENLSTNSSID